MREFVNLQRCHIDALHDVQEYRKQVAIWDVIANMIAMGLNDDTIAKAT